MRKETVFEIFESVEEVAALLGQGVNTVYAWGDIIPEGTAYKLQVLTNNRLVVDPEIYRNKPEKRGRPRKYGTAAK
jgi:hypothetical protein